MQIRHNGVEFDLQFNDNGNMFYIVNEDHEVVEWLCGRHQDAGLNQCWLDTRFEWQFADRGIAVAVELRQTADEPQMSQGVVLCDIIHDEFNDHGFSSFGDFCRKELGQQCQYGSRYIEGRLDNYPALGEGLRFNNGRGYKNEIRPLDARDYHSVRIHRDDMAEFKRRYQEYNANKWG